MSKRLLSWLRKLFRPTLPTPHRRKWRPQLEVLEDRLAPANYTVMTTADSGAGSLRACIDLADLAGGTNTIQFDPSLAGQTIALSTPDDFTFGPSALSITDTITIIGSGEVISRDPWVAHLRLFEVLAGGSLTLSDVTLSNGLAQGGDGGSGQRGGGGGAGLGGAIFNAGIVSLSGVTMTNNTAQGGNAGPNLAAVGVGGGGGGGLGGNGGAAGSLGGGGGGNQGDGANAVDGGAGGATTGGQGGLLTPERGGDGGLGGGGGGGVGSGFRAGGNGGFGGGSGGLNVDEASHGGFGGGGGGFNGFGGFGGGDDAGGGAGLGGAVFNDAGSVSLTNCTFTANSARGGVGGGMGFGGAVFNLNGSMQLNDCTLASNTATAAAGGAIYNLAHEVSEGVTNANPASVTLVNTILYGSSGGATDLVSEQRAGAGSASVTATAPNIVGQFATVGGGIINGSGISTANPLLAGLASNGGPTPTMALQVGSPAIDAGSDSGVPSTDQRGQARLVGAHVDLGAFEDQVVVTAASNQQAAQDVSTSTSLGSFSDQMTGISSWTVSVDWGDNSTTDTFTDTSQGTLPGRSHSYSGVGLFTVTVTVSDSAGNVNRASFQVNVADAPLTAGPLTPPVATEGQALSSVVLLHFTDADPSGTASDDKATVTWGDGSVEDSTTNPGSVQVVANPGGGFDVVGSHTYAEEATGLTFSVNVVNVGGASTDASDSNFSVADAPLTVGAVTPPSAVAGTSTGSVVLFHFSDADPNAASSDFTATVDWGDGSVEDSTNNPGAIQVVVNPGGGFDVVGTHTYLTATAPAAVDTPGLTLAIDVADVGGATCHGEGIVDVSGDAVLNGTPGNDTLTLSAAPGGALGDVRYVLNSGTPITLKNLHSFTFNGMDGDDRMTVNFSPGGALVPGAIQFHGGVGSNSLDLNGAASQSIFRTQPGQVAESALGANPVANQQVVMYDSVATLDIDDAAGLNAEAGPDTADRGGLAAVRGGTAFPGGGTALSASEAFVQALYLDGLGRAGSMSELDGWLPLLQSAGQRAVAMAIEGSFEGDDRLVKSWYQTFLGRPAQGGEERVWVTQLQAGQSEEQVLSGILSSGEFLTRAQQLVSSGTPQQRYVRALYELLLGRTGGQLEIDGWAGTLSDPSTSAQRGQVALSILSGPEFRIYQFEGDFDALLHRPSGSQELHDWVFANLDQRSVRLSFEASPEFFANG